MSQGGSDVHSGQTCTAKQIGDRLRVLEQGAIGGDLQGLHDQMIMENHWSDV